MIDQDPPPRAPRRVPEAYVRAEVAAYPLASKCSFDNALAILDPTLGSTGNSYSETTALWRDCEKTLVEHASGWSLDRIISIRDYFWFGAGERAVAQRESVPMHRYLRSLAALHLQQKPGSTSVFSSTEVDTFDALTHYRWLAFSLPEDLLLASVGIEPPPNRVDLEPPLLLRRLLDDGVAEIHHHVNAGMDFPLMWSSVLAALADQNLSEKALDSPGLFFKDSETILRWLLAAAITRCVLAEFLIRGKNQILDQFLKSLATSFSWPPSRYYLLLHVLRALAYGNEEVLPAFFQLRDLYGELHPEMSINRELPKSLHEVWQRCDPLAARLRLSIPNGGERWLIRHGLAYLERREFEVNTQRSREIEDFTFARLFWQTLRVRCLYYRTIVQRPMTAGLQWFVRFYGRIGLLRTPLKSVRPEISFCVAGRGQPIGALEVRTSPGVSKHELALELRGLTESWRYVLREKVDENCPPEFGVVMHFGKERDHEDRWKKGKPPAYGAHSYAEPQLPYRERIGGRFSEYFGIQAQLARSLVELLQETPQALWLVRGLDVASDELAVPTWVLVPLYRLVQCQAALASADPRAEGPPALRLTAHVGEDVRHLMEGLRRVFECLQYLLERTGGRLGHGTALGLEPRLWAESVGSVMMAAEERLWDLVFEWRLYSGYRIPPDMRAIAPPGRPEQVENRIRELAGGIFSAETPEPHLLAELHHLLHQLFVPPVGVESDGSLDSFEHALLNRNEIRFAEKVEPLLKAYRENEAVFLRCQKLTDIILDSSEIAALYAVQNALRRAVGRRGVVVEVNPSSNLLIGDLLDLRNHPILRLNPPESLPDSPPPVPIAVGSDDPLTFDAYLLREYSLLQEAAIAAGFSERVVHEWLARIRQTSMDARFTVAWLPSAIKRADSLIEEFDHLLHRPQW